MEFDNLLVVPLSMPETWKLLLDIRRISTCIPGAELTEVIDQNCYKGRVAVRFGPVALSLVGVASFESIDEVNYKARVKTHGSDSKGRGSTDSVIDFRLEPIRDATNVLIHTNVKLSGSIAQYGRGSGMIHSFASELIRQFGETLKAQLAASSSSSRDSDIPVAPRPIAGFTLIARTSLRGLSGLFKKDNVKNSNDN